MKLLYIILIILSSFFMAPVSASDSGVLRPGFNLWNWDINLMGKSIHNGTINNSGYTATGDYPNSTISEKLNITGGNVSGQINLTVALNTPLIVNKTGSNNNWVVNISSEGVYSLGITNTLNSSTQGAGIQAISGIQGVTNHSSGDRLGFLLFKAGMWSNGGLYSNISTGAGILSYATEVQTNTNQGADLRLVATKTGTVLRNTIILLKDDNVTLPYQAGTGTRAACFDSNGVLVASTNVSSSNKTC